MESQNITLEILERSVWWFHDISEILPGHSAILGGNATAFYVVHILTVAVILVSLFGCVAVISSVCRDSSSKWDFSDRFPLYLAVSDLLWNISNLFGDQLYLLLNPVFPPALETSILALNVAFFFGYQQLMNAGLSLYTYLKVVKSYFLDLGHWEWRLHCFVLGFLAVYLGTFYWIGALGSSGYWFLCDYNTTTGKYFTVVICITCTIHALCTFWAYHSIHKVIQEQSSKMNGFYTNSTNNCDSGKKGSMSQVTGSGNNKSGGSYHATASKCLTTYVLIALCLYLPLAICAWICAIEAIIFGVVDPFMSILIGIGANSGGWVNAYGYFYNKKIKRQRVKETLKRKSQLGQFASDSATSSSEV